MISNYHTEVILLFLQDEYTVGPAYIMLKKENAELGRNS